MAIRILFISNGSGEDCVSAALINAVRLKKNDSEIMALPLVGEGRIFKDCKVDTVGPLKEMPSSGLINNNIKALLKDIKSGLFALTLGQIKTIRNKRHFFDLIVCVGDRYPLILAGFLTDLPIIFVGIAQSVRVHGYSLFEKFLLKKRVNIVFTRDEETACNLKKSHINAIFPGNPMMDTFSIERVEPDFDKQKISLAILPGSRGELEYNLKICLNVCCRLNSLSSDILFLLALSPEVSLERLSLPEGWTLIEPEINNFFLLRHKDGTEIRLSQKHFGYIINRAQVVLGLGGTANEQAAGLGKPVVTFWSPKRQVRPAFIKHQKSLLGESLIVLPPDMEIIAQKIFYLIENPVKRRELGDAGFKMMGERGGIAGIVEHMIKFIDDLN